MDKGIKLSDVVTLLQDGCGCGGSDTLQNRFPKNVGKGDLDDQYDLGYFIAHAMHEEDRKCIHKIVKQSGLTRR